MNTKKTPQPSLSLPLSTGVSFVPPKIKSTLKSLVLCCSVISAIQVYAGSITGVVTDGEHNSNLIGAAIQIRESGRTAVTDTSGEFSIHNLAAGTYTVVATSMGFDSTTTTLVVPEDGEVIANFKLASDVVKLDKFVVGGTREGQAKAFQQKQTADNLLDIVSADAAGKLPDGNAAEALRRLPGVVAEVDQNEARYIVVRGMDSALNNVTINGQLVGSPDGGTRAVAMDSVPADLISRIELTKAVTPDMDHNAIGGSINIVLPSAFDRSEAFANASVSYGYNELKSNGVYNLSATYGTTFAEKKWGFIVGASFSNRDYGSYRLSTNDNAWFQRPDTTIDNGGTDYHVPANQTFYDYNLNRRRGGINGSLEFRPLDHILLYTRINYNTFRDDETRQGLEYDLARGTLSNQTPTSGSYSEGRVSRGFRSYKQKHLILNLQLGGEIKLGAGKLDFNGTYGEANRDTPRRVDWTFRSNTSMASSYDTSSSEFMVTPKNMAAFDNPASYPLYRLRRRTDKEEETTKAASLNYRLDNQLFKLPGYWKTGARFITRDKFKDRENEAYVSKIAFTLADFNIARAPSEMDDFYNGRYHYGPSINYDNAERFYSEHKSDYFKTDDASATNLSLAEDFQVGEDVFSAYVMRQMQWSKWTLLFGVRWEHTKGDYTANMVSYKDGAIRLDTAVGKTHGSVSYDDVKPGIHLRYNPMKPLVFRASWTNTLGRPAYSKLAPTVTYDWVDDITPGHTGQYIGSLSVGNPDLKPYRSMNFDLSGEYYLKQTGIISVSVFHKIIDDPIYQRGDYYENYTFDGKTFSTFTFTRDENAKSGKVTGIEFNYQQYFKSLPKPFDGLGFSVNYTWTDSEVNATVYNSSKKTTETRKTDFFKQAKGAGNVALLYEKYRLTARLALNYSGSYLKSLSSAPITDIYADDRTTLDAKVSYKISKNWTIFGEMQNIAKEPLREYIGRSYFVSGMELYSWTATFGVNWKM